MGVTSTRPDQGKTISSKIRLHLVEESHPVLVIICKHSPISSRLLSSLPSVLAFTSLHPNNDISLRLIKRNIIPNLLHLRQRVRIIPRGILNLRLIRRHSVVTRIAFVRAMGRCGRRAEVGFGDGVGRELAGSSVYLICMVLIIVTWVLWTGGDVRVLARQART